jgi:hypothetical protein
MSISYLLKKHTIDSTYRTNYELYVSEAGGKVVLDTVVDYNKTITADLVTSAKYLDVSIIYSMYPAGANPFFMINSYKSIDLAQWKNIPLSDSVPGQAYPMITGTAAMQLKNVGTPAPFYWQFMCNDDPGEAFFQPTILGFTPEGVSYTSDLSINYTWEQDAYAYIAFPYAARYKLHKINGPTDTVDCSQLDTARTVSFNWAPQYDILPRLFGYMDTTNRDKSLLLAPGHGQYTHAYSYETMYPAKKGVFQKYDLLLTGYPNASGPGGVPVQAGIRWTWLDTIPVVVPFLDATYYTVKSQTPDSFSVSWPKTKPTFYTLSTSFNIGEFLLTASADTTVLDPERMLVRLEQGKLLKGASAPMFINGFTMNIDDNPDYQSYMIKEGDVTAANKRPMSNQSVLAVALGYQGGTFTTKFFQRSTMMKR